MMQFVKSISMITPHLDESAEVETQIELTF
jgi:hypothetical protein